MEHFDVLLVGAGLFNAVLAHQFSMQGKKVLVIERREEIGGNCHTYECHGIDIHNYGAHIFHTSNTVIWNFANYFAKFRQFTNSPVAMVMEEGKYRAYNLPFNMNTFSQLWGCTTPSEARKTVDEATAPYIRTRYANMEEKALSMVGPDIYEKFIKGYTEKQWHMPCAELSPSIISRIPLRFTYDNNYFNNVYQGIPEQGYTKWIENMLSDATVRTGVDYLKHREKYDSMADMVFYSGAVDEFFGYSEGELHYRSLRFVHREIHGTSNYQGVAVCNYPGLEVDHTRTIEHRHFLSPRREAVADNDFTLVTTEYPADYVRGGEAYYPVGDAESRALYAKYMEMRPKNVVFTGRLGRFEYNDMDVTIEKALKVAEEYR